MDLGTLGTYIKNSVATKLNSLLPSQSGNSGKVLSTNGTALSWVEAGSGGGGTSTVFHSQTDFNIDGNNGTYFLITSSETAPSISLSNITIGVMYYIRVLSQSSFAMTIALPNTADIRPSNVISVSPNTYKTIAMVYDGTLREWQISETGASI